MQSALRLSRLLPLLICGAPLLAQGVSSQLTGRITAKGGGGIAGATVTIRNQETGLIRTAVTDANGRYFAPTLPVGAYAVTVAAKGYQTAANLKVTLNLGDAAPLNVTMAAEAAITVEVVASVATVDQERASTAAFISPEAISSIPMKDRSFTTLATLTPQVVVDSQRGNLAIAGQRGVNTSINIDGGDNNEPFFGGAVGAAEGKTPFTISSEAIREYQVITDGASAEFGRMGGGYLNAITKNGTNEYTGSLFYYARPKSMVAKRPDQKVVGDFKQAQFGFASGGPIIKDTLFYFVAYDGQRRTTPINMAFGNPDPTKGGYNTLVASNPYDAVLLSKQGNYDSKADSDTVFARFDWNINANNVIQARVNHSKFTGDTGSGTTAAYENMASDVVKSDAYVLQWNMVINANWMNEFRFNYVKDDMPRDPYSTTPEVSITGGGYYGAYPFDRTYSTKRKQFVENISYTTPTLQLKAGVDYNAVDVAEFFAGNWRGVYYFDNLANYRAGKWTTYRQNFGLNGDVRDAGQFSAETKQIAAYLQADWRISEELKVGLGVRWDKQQNPDYPILDYSNPMAKPMPLTAKIPNDSQFSPRLSFTWTPGFDGGKTVVRGSVGRYVSTTPAVFLYQVFAANARRTGQVDFKAADATTFGIPYGNTGASAFNPANPFWFSAFPSAAAAKVPAFSIWTFSQDFKNPYTDRVNVAVERSFDALVTGLSATYAKGNQLERTRDVNIGTPSVNAYGRTVYSARPNTTYQTMGQYMSDGTSLYHAYTLSLKYHKADSPIEADLYYTYSINKDFDSNERNYSGIGVQDVNDPYKDWGYADTDRRSVLTGYISFNEKRFSGILASLSVRYLSGSPYSVTYSKDMNGDGATTNDRFYIYGQEYGRNSKRTCSQTTLDLGLRRDWTLVGKVKFTASVDIFNILNRQDTYWKIVPSSNPVSTDAAPAVTKNWTMLGDTRQVQLGARLSF
ncbi:TonB-dependent receptor [Mesoterricola sediminis]|uniref:TonB-dependent transporter Oar-like beta-barrel domain-containing protein n=1 Tax=Mesoterricola sediminis TaxID=2927980 RepID=A0AA48H6J5_9BACT|nr:TonB-dependent receptor [Mesoterricola sediminis]BDU76903.1 hypothetical protein METESE_18610 [Mesoterricola sediminis]